MRIRIVDQLKRALKGDWRAVRNGFGWYWTDGTRIVRVYSEVDPNDDDQFSRVYIMDGVGTYVGRNGFIYGGGVWP